MADRDDCITHSEKIAVMSAVLREINRDLEGAFARIDELKAEVVTLRISFAEIEGDVRRAKEDIEENERNHTKLKNVTYSNKGGLMKIFAVVSAFVVAAGLGLTIWKFISSFIKT
jgi:chromosome segregation ATPase